MIICDRCGKGVEEKHSLIGLCLSCYTAWYESDEEKVQNLIDKRFVSHNEYMKLYQQTFSEEKISVDAPNFRCIRKSCKNCIHIMYLIEDIYQCSLHEDIFVIHRNDFVCDDHEVDLNTGLNNT